MVDAESTCLIFSSSASMTPPCQINPMCEESYSKFIKLAYIVIFTALDINFEGI